ncbi:MAG TPA: VOC family protein [Sphingobacteriaceae bacterium]
MKIVAYLTFNGTCREAMIFYQECLGGILRFQTVGESPMADRLPPELHDCIVTASLTGNDLVLVGSDMVSEDGLVRGNAVSLLLSCNSAEETHSCYDRLSRDGTREQALEETFWGTLFGGVRDKYGNSWLVHYEDPAQNRQEAGKNY